MATYTESCNDCSEQKQFSGNSWNDIKPQVEAWEREHEEQMHGGAQVSGWSGDPNPMRMKP